MHAVGQIDHRADVRGDEAQALADCEMLDSLAGHIAVFLIDPRHRQGGVLEAAAGKAGRSFIAAENFGTRINQGQIFIRPIDHRGQNREGHIRRR